MVPRVSRQGDLYAGDKRGQSTAGVPPTPTGQAQGKCRSHSSSNQRGALRVSPGESGHRFGLILLWGGCNIWGSYGG